MEEFAQAMEANEAQAKRRVPRYHVCYGDGRIVTCNSKNDLCNVEVVGIVDVIKGHKLPFEIGGIKISESDD